MSVETGQNALASDLNNIDHFDAGETIAEGDAVSLNYADYKIYKASAAAFDHRLNFIGFAMEAGSNNNPIQVNVRTVVNEKSGLTADTLYYLSDTQGAIATAAGTFERLIGRAVTTSKIIRKRGVVSQQIQLLEDVGYTAPCDLLAIYANDTSNPGLELSGSDNYDPDYSVTSVVQQGQALQFGNSGSSVDIRHVFLLDFGGFF